MADRLAVKICGIRDAAMAAVATEAGASFIGLVFVPSPRQVTVEQAAAIVRTNLDRFGSLVDFVGLFVDKPAARINKIAAEVGLDYVQLCGNEPPTILEELDLLAIKTLRCGGQASVDELLHEADAWQAGGATVLLDAPGAGGGHGKLANWAYASVVASHYPVILAGGLTPSNVGAAVATVRPWAVDVSSGVELERGVKDATLIREFIHASKNIEFKPEVQRNSSSPLFY